MKPNNSKDLISTILGVAQFLAVTIFNGITAANGGKINWTVIAMSSVLGVLGIFTGKNSDLSTKTPDQINNAINPPKPPNV